jgi:hypothetical protein
LDCKCKELNISAKIKRFGPANKKAIFEPYFMDLPSMIRKLAAITLFITLAISVLAQSTENSTPAKSKRPDIPGTFTLELGVNRLTEKPNELKYGFWGSRTLNTIYQYDMRIAKSKFSFHPGVGLSMERFKLLSSKQYFSNDTVSYVTPTLAYDGIGNTTFLPSANYIYDDDSLAQINWASSFSLKKSMVALTYVDVPLEFRFSTMPDDPARSFKVAVGGRVGYLLNAHTKIKYKEDGDLKNLKNTQHYNINRFRYSAYMKIYLGNFGIFGYYNLNPLFEDGKGPMKTQAQSYTVGITLSSF